MDTVSNRRTHDRLVIFHRCGRLHSSRLDDGGSSCSSQQWSRISFQQGGSRMDDDSSTSTLTRRKFANAGDKLTGRSCFMRNLPVNVQANPTIVSRRAHEETVRFEKVVGRLWTTDNVREVKTDSYWILPYPITRMDYSENRIRNTWQRFASSSIIPISRLALHFLYQVGYGCTLTGSTTLPSSSTSTYFFCEIKTWRM